jgi:hypothetical protein
VAWGIKNTLTELTSYFVMVDGSVGSCLYVPLPEDEQADSHILKM